jgi:DNA modification methylase
VIARKIITMEKRGKPFRPQQRSQPPKPPMRVQTTTLWEYPSQDYEGPNGETHGDKNYVGATPAWVIWNVVQRYSKPKDLVIDPMSGSGTTIDVARELGRKALGYDVNPTRTDIFRVDARKLPPELTGKVSIVFVDPPYSTHVDYSDDPRCIGKLSALEEGGKAYYDAMAQVLSECNRVLKPGGHLAVYVSDTFKKGSPNRFSAIGFELFGIARQWLEPVDIITVVRHNAKLQMGNFHMAAEEGNFFLRGFNYLMLFRKP